MAEKRSEDMTEEGTSDRELIVRIDENMTFVKDKLIDHEERIRDNEKFKNMGKGAIALLSISVVVITAIIIGILTG